MDEMVQRVARAIALAPMDTFEAQAVAAIEAMREPTEAMIEAGYANNFANPAYAAWQAMIDTALSETAS